MNVPLQTTLADAVALLQTEHIPHALIGGLAASLRGESRVTADVDLVIQANVDEGLNLSRRLEGSNFAPLFADPTDVIERSFILPLRHRSTNVKVDLTLGLSGYERQLIDRAQPVEIGGTVVSVATAEDLIVLKALAGRPQDQQDMLGIVAAQGDQLDWEYCLTIAHELGEAIGQDVVAPIRALRRQQ